MQEQEAQVALAEKPARASLRKGGKTTAEKSANSARSGAKSTQAKAASKPTAKPAKTVKTAPKEAAPKVAFVPRLMQKGKPIFALDEIARPRSGRLLLAHTHAALTVLGLMAEARPAIPKNSLLTLIGARAVKYHIDSDNLEDAPDGGIRLSLKGFNTFKTRDVDAAAANAFQSAFLDGKADPSINVSASRLFQTNIG